VLVYSSLYIPGSADKLVAILTMQKVLQGRNIYIYDEVFGF
jgi:hypothetical protein